MTTTNNNNKKQQKHKGVNTSDMKNALTRICLQYRVERPAALLTEDSCLIGTRGLDRTWGAVSMDLGVANEFKPGDMFSNRSHKLQENVPMT